MKTRKKIIIGLVAIAIVSFPSVISFAKTINQHFATYGLNGLGEVNFTFSESGSMVYHSNNLTVTKILHDGDQGNCNFCQIQICGKKKGLMGMYSNIGKNNINTPHEGTYNGANYGNVGTGTFKYYIKNHGAFRNEGTFRVNVSD